MSTTICPYLERDEQGQFRCKVLGSVVDPVALNCLGKFWECPYYLQAQQERELSIEEEREIEKIPEEEIKPIEETIPEETRPEIEKGILSVELAQSIETLFKNFDILDDYWEKYSSEAKRVLDMWDRLRDRLASALKVLRDLLDSIDSEINELDVRKELGLIGEEEYTKLKEILEERRSKLEAEYQRLSDMFENAERRSIDHKRKALASIPLIKSKLKAGLIRLETLYREGKISDDLFSKLKQEIEKALGEEVM